MDNDELHKLLEQVHAEIERAGTLDDANRELPQELWGDIHALLKRTEPAEKTSAVRRLEESIEQLGAEHPSLTAALGELLQALSNAGV